MKLDQSFNPMLRIILKEMNIHIKPSANIIFSILLIISLAGCDVTRETKRASNLASCDFRILSVRDLNLAGVKIDQIKSVNDLNFGDIALVMAGLTGSVCPLTLSLDIEGHNPNTRDAGVNKLEWILFIDDIKMTSGVLDQPFTIPGKGTLEFRVPVKADLKQMLSGKSGTAVLNFCMNLSGSGGKPSRFKIKLKPTIIVSGKPFTYPGFITVNTEYGTKQTH